MVGFLVAAQNLRQGKSGVVPSENPLGAAGGDLAGTRQKGDASRLVEHPGVGEDEPPGKQGGHPPDGIESILIAAQITGLDSAVRPPIPEAERFTEPENPLPGEIHR